MAIFKGVQPGVSKTFRLLRGSLLHCLAKAPTLYSWMLMARGARSLERLHYVRLIRQGDAVFDVGANIGNFTVLFSDLVGPRGSVHAFEPVPPTFKLLSERIRCDGRHQNILTNSVACSDEPGTVEIAVPGGDLGQSAMCPHASYGSWGTSSKMERFPVPTIRLDDYATEGQLTRLDFIKCDVEGAELLVLKGSTRLLHEFEPLLHLEVAEFWTRDFGYDSSDLIDFLEKQGYSYFLIEDEPIQLGLLRVRLAECAARTESVNLLCACPSRADRLKRL